MAAARLAIRAPIASPNPVFRLMAGRTLATTSASAPASRSAADMSFTFASPSEVNYWDIEKKKSNIFLLI